MKQTVGILGGSGPAGRGVAVRLAAAQTRVIVGSRDAERGVAAAVELGGESIGITGGDNALAATADIVIVATPWEGSVATVKEFKDALAGKIVISMVNALVKQGRELVPVVPPRGSMLAEIQAAIPGSFVTGAFHHLPAADMENLDSGLNADVIVIGDDVAARATTVELVNEMPGLRAIEAGSTALAGSVEAFTAVCISVNIRHRKHTYVTLSGFDA
jgi:NADPH-dependent F420 reductase